MNKQSGTKLATLREMTSHLYDIKKDWKVLLLLLSVLVLLVSSEPYFYRWLI